MSRGAGSVRPVRALARRSRLRRESRSPCTHGDTPARGAPRMSLTLRTISREQHLAYIQSLPAASHCQVPAWADVKSEWRSESLGWFDEQPGQLTKGGQQVGAALVLYRQLPKVKRYLAYLPEGPVINWYAPNLDEWLQPMLRHLKQQGSFTVKMGPPVIIRRWEATTIKAGIADPDIKR